jgi:hypothetical protein
MQASSSDRFAKKGIDRHVFHPASLSGAVQKLHPVVFHVADILVRFPHRHRVCIVRPQKVDRRWQRVVAGKPSLVILWLRDHRHAVVNLCYVELKIYVKERQSWSSRLAVLSDENSRGKGGLFLKAGMAVIPVCAAPDYRYAVGECFLRRDTGKAQAGDSVHVGRQTDRVPMDGRHRLQTVRDQQRDGLALPPSQRCTEPFTAVASRCRPVKFTGK